MGEHEGGALSTGSVFTFRNVVKVGLLWAAEYAMLSLIEDAPRTIKWATLIFPLAALGVMQFEEPLRRKFRDAFGILITIIGAGYLIIAITFGFILQPKALDPAAATNMGAAEAQKSTLIVWLQQAQRERDAARQQVTFLQANNRGQPSASAIPDILQQVYTKQEANDLINTLNTLSPTIEILERNATQTLNKFDNEENELPITDQNTIKQRITASGMRAAEFQKELSSTYAILAKYNDSHISELIGSLLDTGSLTAALVDYVNVAAYHDIQEWSLFHVARKPILTELGQYVTKIRRSKSLISEAQTHLRQYLK